FRVDARIPQETIDDRLGGWVNGERRHPPIIAPGPKRRTRSYSLVTLLRDVLPNHGVERRVGGEAEADGSRRIEATRPGAGHALDARVAFPPYQGGHIG